MGRNFTYFSVYITLVFFDFTGAADFNQPKLLPDGLLVTGGSTDRSIHNVVDTWSLHVVVDVLVPPNDRLHEQVQQLPASLTDSRCTDNDTRAFWLTRSFSLLIGDASETSYERFVGHRCN